MTRRMTSGSWMLPAVAALTIFGAALRVPFAGVGVWRDEAYTYFDVVQPTLRATLEHIARVETNPPLFFLLERGIGSLFGFGELALKCLPLACGILLIPATFVFASALMRPRAALLATWLAATTEPAIYYSQELRPYTLDRAARRLDGERVRALAGRARAAVVGALGAAVGLHALRWDHLHRRVNAGDVLPARFRPSPARPLDRTARAARPSVRAVASGLRTADARGHALDRLPALGVAPGRGGLFDGVYVSRATCAAPRRASPSRTQLDRVRHVRALLASAHARRRERGATGRRNVRHRGDGLVGSDRGSGARVPRSTLRLSRCSCRRSPSTRGCSTRSRRAPSNAPAARPPSRRWPGVHRLGAGGNRRAPDSVSRAAAEERNAGSRRHARRRELRNAAILVAPGYAAASCAFYAPGRTVYGFPRWNDPQDFDIAAETAAWAAPDPVGRTLKEISRLAENGTTLLAVVRPTSLQRPFGKSGVLPYQITELLTDELSRRYRVVDRYDFPANVEWVR